MMLSGCQTTVAIPDNFTYREVATPHFNIAAYTKISDATTPYHIYIEGDGHAFYADGRVSSNPTPHGDLMRRAAFGDTSPNVIYLARPCQYISGGICAPQYWSNARFAPEVIDSEYAAIISLAGDAPKILIGYSGGAQVAGLLAALKPDLNVRKIITLAGNLDHRAWTKYHRLPPLDKSMSLTDHREKFLSFPQVHYVGGKDKVIPLRITEDFIGDSAAVVKVDKAGHGNGWDDIIPLIYKE